MELLKHHESGAMHGAGAPDTGGGQTPSGKADPLWSDGGAGGKRPRAALRSSKRTGLMHQLEQEAEEDERGSLEDSPLAQRGAAETPLRQQLQIGFAKSDIARVTTTAPLAHWADARLLVTGGMSFNSTLVLTACDHDVKGRCDFLGQASFALDEVLATYTLSRPWQRIGVSAPPRPPREVVLPLREMLVNPLDEKGRPLRLDMDAEMSPTGLISAAIEQLPHTVTCCSLLDERVQTKGSMFLGSWRPLWACLAQGSLRLYENRASLADAPQREIPMEHVQSVDYDGKLEAMVVKIAGTHRALTLRVPPPPALAGVEPGANPNSPPQAAAARPLAGGGGVGGDGKGSPGKDEKGAPLDNEEARGGAPPLGWGERDAKLTSPLFVIAPLRPPPSPSRRCGARPCSSARRAACGCGSCAAPRRKSTATSSRPKSSRRASTRRLRASKRRAIGRARASSLSLALPRVRARARARVPRCRLRETRAAAAAARTREPRCSKS